MIKVSVVVPIFNVEEYLERCVKSLLNQTLDDIEIILVNDGSKDKSGEIAQDFSNKYPEKIIYVEKKNGGLSDARNYGMKFATGEYIAFLDSDDYIEKEAYEEMYRIAKKDDSDLVECDFVWEYPKKIRKDEQIKYTNKKELLAFIRVVAWNKLIRRKILVDNHIEFPKGLRYEDVEFTYMLIPHIHNFSYINKFFVHYTQRNNSIANVQNEKTAEIFTILDNVIKYYKDNGLYDEYEEELEYNYARYLLCSSLKRICKIQDKPKREELINKTWDNLTSKYPEWKNNEILKNTNLNKNKYMRSINKTTYKIYTKLFRII